MKDLILLGICIVGFVSTFFLPEEAVDWLCVVLGSTGAVYCGYILWLMFFCPIKRDRIMVRGHYLWKMLNFVLLMPFVLTFGYLAYDYMSGEEYSTKNIIYDSSLYEGGDDALEEERISGEGIGPDSPDDKPIRTRITFIDSNADREREYFTGRFQNLFDLSISRYVDADACDDVDVVPWNDPMPGSRNYSYLGNNFLDIEWEFIKGDVAQPTVKRYLEASAEAARPGQECGRSILTLAICLPMAHESVAAGIYLPETVYDYAQQVLVYQTESSDIVYNLCYDEREGGVLRSKRYAKLRPFGMTHTDFSIDKAGSARCMLCNYIYHLMFDLDADDAAIKAGLLAIGDPFDKQAMKGPKEEWDKKSISDKWANRYLTNCFATRLRSAGGEEGLVTYMDELAEAEHNRWTMQQLLMGYRAYTAGETRLLAGLLGKKEETRAFKARLKNGPDRAHLNICSFEYLEKVDPWAKPYDQKFNSVIPTLLSLFDRR